jgi:hypothetical protein
MADIHGEPIGHSGLTYRQWEDRRIAEFLAGRRDTVTDPHDFDREFVADADGMMPPIAAIINCVTGQPVPCDPPLRVHVDDLDRVVAEYQARFLAEWEAGAEERAKRKAFPTYAEMWAELEARIRAKEGDRG